MKKKLVKSLGYILAPVLVVCLVYGGGGGKISAMAAQILTSITTLVATTGGLGNAGDVFPYEVDNRNDWTIGNVSYNVSVGTDEYSLWRTTYVSGSSGLSGQVMPEEEPDRDDHAISFTAGTEGIFEIRIDTQGDEFMKVVRNAMGKNYKDVFCFNIVTKDGLTYDKKQLRVEFEIPEWARQEGKKAILIGVDKKGQPKIFGDMDKDDASFTAQLNIEGYAFCVAYEQ